MSETRYTIALPQPHAKQLEFMQSPAKRKVVVAGRRGGKTTGVSMLAANAAMQGRRVLEAAPVADQTSAFWDAITKYFAEPISDKIVRKNETERLIELPNKGRIRCKTAFDADTLRGDYADLLILDEFSLMKPSAWDEVGAPMLLDNDGDAVFIFTPKRKNHAHKVYANAIGDLSGRWAGWHFTSFDNPYLSREALDEITKDMTESAYRQEIMAEFLENEGAVFRNLDKCMDAPIATPEQHAKHHVCAGIDWGQKSDFTAISVGCADCHKEIFRDRFNQNEWQFMYDRLKNIFNVWSVKYAIVETNSIGQPGFEALQRGGFPVDGFDTTPKSKPPLIENLSLCFEREEFQYQFDPIWVAELEAYERAISPTTGRSSYSAPSGMHDDTVIARALMFYATCRRTVMTQLVYDVPTIGNY